MSNSVFLKPDENGNWGSVNVIGGGGGIVTSSLLTFQSAATGTGNGTAIDVSGYTTLTVDIVISATATVQYETSLDNTNWNPTLSFPFDQTSTTTSTTATRRSLRFNVSSVKYIRFRISSYGSGTVDVSGYASSSPTTQNLPLSGLAGADAASGSSPMLNTSTLLMGYNGSTWDRLRTSGTGALRTAVFDSTGLSAQVSAYTADAMGAGYQGLCAVSFGMGFNGSTIDRVRVSKTFKWNEYLGLTTGTSFTVWTPTSTKTLRIMGMSVSVSGACALNVRVGTAGSGSRIAVLRFAGADNYMIDFGNGYKATNATTDVLEINNPSSNPTSATVDVHVSAWGTEE